MYYHQNKYSKIKSFVKSIKINFFGKDKYHGKDKEKGNANHKREGFEAVFVF